LRHAKFFGPLRIGILVGVHIERKLLQQQSIILLRRLSGKDNECPVAHLGHHFTKGDIQDFDAVYQFGKGLMLLLTN